MSLIPWSQGLSLLSDFTCLDTLAPSNLSTSTASWQILLSQEIFFLDIFLSLLPFLWWDPGWLGFTCSFFGKMDRVLVTEQSGDSGATVFRIQQIAMKVQRGNAASVMATYPSTQDWAEFASLPTVWTIYVLCLVFFVGYFISVIFLKSSPYFYSPKFFACFSEISKPRKLFGCNA